METAGPAMRKSERVLEDTWHVDKQHMDNSSRGHTVTPSRLHRAPLFT